MKGSSIDFTKEEIETIKQLACNAMQEYDIELIIMKLKQTLKESE